MSSGLGSLTRGAWSVLSPGVASGKGGEILRFSKFSPAWQGRGLEALLLQFGEQRAPPGIRRAPFLRETIGGVRASG